MDQRSAALGNLDSKRKFVSAVAPTGTISKGSYAGQAYEIIAARRGFPSWYRVILKDESGVAERDIREEFLYGAREDADLQEARP